MQEIRNYRSSTIRYWEKRRIIYNLALIPVALIGFFFTDTFNWVGDSHTIHYSELVLPFGVSAFGANVCYSFAYAMEFLFGNGEPSSGWMRFGRSLTFIAGLLFSILLSFLVGKNIADFEYSFFARN